MVLGLEVHGEVVTAYLQNRGDQPQRVIASGVLLTLERPGWTGEVFDHTGATHLDQDESFATIRPRDQLAIPIDVGGREIVPGTYTVTASYEAMTAAVGDWWNGRLRAGPVTVRIQ
jgi:hypothetical protein